MDQLNAMKLDLDILMTNYRALTTPHTTNNDQSIDLNIPNSTTTMTYAQHLTANITPSTSSPITRKIHPNFTITLENIPKTSLNRISVTKFISDMNFNISSIYNMTFNPSLCFLTFTTLFAKDSFLALDFKETLYKHIFKHVLLTTDQVHIGRIYYHAITNNLITGYKCPLNLKTNKYELRLSLDKNKTDWKSKPLIPTDDQLTDWTESLNEYIKNDKRHDKST